MSLKYINETYGLNVRRGDVLEYMGTERLVVVGSSGQYLRLRPENDLKAKSRLYHPTWQLAKTSM